jgi:hypothetical protein
MNTKVKLWQVALVCAAISLMAVAGTLVDRGAGWGYNPSPLSAYGAVTLAAATATQVPTSPIAHGAIMIQNRGSASIYCGSDTSVTDSNGIEVLQNAVLSVPISYNTSTSTVKIYCYSVAGQTAPANTRYWESL